MLSIGGQGAKCMGHNSNAKRTKAKEGQRKRKGNGRKKGKRGGKGLK